MNEKLYSDDCFHIFREHGISPSVNKLLNQTVWGSGGAHYEHGSENKVKTMFNPYVMTLEKKSDLVACALFCKRSISSNNFLFDSYYTRYFSASPKFRGKGLMKKYGAPTMKLIRDGITSPSLFYALVEKKNYASQKVVESVGYKKTAKIKTVGISRFFPKTTASVRKLKEEELPQMINKLSQQYAQHSFVQFNSLKLNNDYYVLEKNNEIVAGLQLERGEWQIKNMPGLMGTITMNIVPHIPILNRIFNPKHFQFLGLEGIYIKLGHDKDFLKLIEHLLNKNSRNSALIFMDEKCPMYQNISKNKLGLLNTFTKDSDSYLMLASENIDSQIIDTIKDAPAYISCYDLL